MADYSASYRRAGRMPLAPIRRQGAWKLAYADFLTALCAFFLVMWLIHGASKDQRAEIAGQFGSHPASTTSLSALPIDPIAPVMETLEESELLRDHATNVIVHADGKLIRLELVDLDRSPLFDKGNASLNPRGQEVIALAAKAVSALSLPVSIEGHTDSDPISRDNYSNWELSADRANAARRGLLEGGVDGSLIQSVAGLADTRPLQDGPSDLPQNRRLSIVVHIK